VPVWREKITPEEEDLSMHRKQHELDIFLKYMKRNKEKGRHTWASTM